MTTWNKQKVDPSTINNGNEFVAGDGVRASDINKMFEGIFHVQEQLDDQLAALQDGTPKYVEFESIILSKTSNEGVLFAGDTQHKYFWNGTRYVDGGAYQADFSVKIITVNYEGSVGGPEGDIKNYLARNYSPGEILNMLILVNYYDATSTLHRYVCYLGSNNIMDVIFVATSGTVGDLDDLKTTNKNNLVDAINDIVIKIYDVTVNSDGTITTNYWNAPHGDESLKYTVIKLVDATYDDVLYLSFSGYEGNVKYFENNTHRIIFDGDDHTVNVIRLNYIDQNYVDKKIVKIYFSFNGDSTSAIATIIKYFKDTYPNYVSDLNGKLFLFVSNDTQNIIENWLVWFTDEDYNIMVTNLLNYWYGDYRNTEDTFKRYNISATETNRLNIGNLTDLTTTAKNNLVGAINEVNKNTNKNELELIDLKEALYGYVLDTAPVEITSIIPDTTTINDTTYNLVDNVRGLINEVKGNTLKSDNLIVLEDVEEATTNGLTYSLKNGVITLNGGLSGWGQLLKIDVNSNDILYFNAFASGTMSDSGGFYVEQENGITYNTNKEYNGIKSIVFYTNGDGTYTNRTYKPMLVKGSTAPSEFKQGFNGLKSVEYEGLKIKGRNLLDLSSGNWSNYSDNIVYDKDTSTIIAKNSKYVEITLSNPIILKKGTYTFIRDFASNSNMVLKDKYGNAIIGLTYGKSKTTNTIDTDTHIKKFMFNGEIGSYKLSLEIGTITTSDYKTPCETNILPFNTTLRGVGTAKDKIVITKNSDNEYYTATKVVNCDSVDLGSLNWEYDSNQKECFRATLSLSKLGTGGKPNILTTKYETGTQSATIATNGYISMFNGTNILFIHDNSITEGDYASFKTAMSGEMLVYELAIPTQEVLSTNLTEAEVMQLLELGGSVEIINSNSDFVNGTTTIEMVYKLINS